MKILMTGCSGFIGQALIPRLLSEGHEVFGLYEHENSKEKNPQLAGKQYVADLKDRQALEQVIINVQPEIVIHLAAKTEVALSFANYYEVSQVNYLGTVALAEACRQYVEGFKCFFMATTMETYGHQPEPWTAFTEETEQHPMAPYAVAKKACELYLEYMKYAYNFPFVGFRQTNAYGRHDNDFFIVERIISQMVKGSIVNLGDPEPWRNFLYIDDLVELYVQAINNLDKVRGQFFVTGPNNALQIKDLYNMIARLVDWTGTVNWHTIPKRPGEIYYLNSNPAKLKEVLGWEPKVSLEEGLLKTIEIWKQKNEQKLETV